MHQSTVVARETFLTHFVQRYLSQTKHPPLLELSDVFPLLITGISGVIGYNAFYLLQAMYPGRVWGQRPEKTFRLDGPGVIASNMGSVEEMRQMIDRLRIRSILHCGGNCALKSCELDPAMAYRVNVQSLENLLIAAAGRVERFVGLSVDLVYSGHRPGGYREHDPVDPVTVYGKTMSEAERLIFDYMPHATVLRISLPMGISFNGHAGAIDWIQSRFRAGRPATLYFDEVRTPTYVECMTDMLQEALRVQPRGLFHAGGPRRLSLYQIGQIVNRVGGYDPRLLRGCMRIEAGPMPPRAGNVALDSSALRQWYPRGLRAWPYHDHLVPTDDQWHTERSHFSGGPHQIAHRLYSIGGQE